MAFVFVFVMASSGADDDDDEFLYATFPTGFKWGLGTAAYQVEGAWNESGKGASIWDTYVHQEPSQIAGGGTADVSCDSYHRFEQDVAALKSVGVRIVDRIDTSALLYHKLIKRALLPGSAISIFHLLGTNSTGRHSRNGQPSGS